VGVFSSFFCLGLCSFFVFDVRLLISSLFLFSGSNSISCPSLRTWTAADPSRNIFAHITKSHINRAKGFGWALLLPISLQDSRTPGVWSIAFKRTLKCSTYMCAFVFSLIDGQMLTKCSQVGPALPLLGLVYKCPSSRGRKVEKCLPTPKFQAIKSLWC